MGVPGEWAPVIDILEEFAWRRLDGWLDQHLVQLREHDDPFETANFLAGLGIFSFVEPDWVTLFDPFPYPGPAGVLVPGAGPGDPYLPKQSALHLTKAIKVHDNGFFGDPKVRIAILDVGIDQSHEDLKHVVVESYDVITGTGSPIPLDDQPHGTGCAGLAAAEANQVGIRGVAAGCSLLAVRISETVTNHPDHVIANSRIAQGIKWAIEHQAAVISLSWYTFPDSTCVTTMVRFALDEGRAKKGCVVVCAAGNRYPGTSGNEVDFPASIDGVIAVGACTNEQNPGPKLLGFGEAWETAAGDKVWVVAPGVNNLTTDLVGSKGADLGDYFSFSGTSSATPLVAGAAALLLSRNPNLTVARIREIFRETAVQVPCKGIYDPQTGHHRQMGFGMLDVLAAVNKA
jgi:subtilisin family serine protease